MTKRTQANLKLGLLAVLTYALVHLVCHRNWQGNEKLSPIEDLDPQESPGYWPFGSKKVPEKFNAACDPLNLSIPGPITSQDPHTGHFIKVYLNSLAKDGVANRANGPLSVGSTVVKEKYRDLPQTSRFAYAAMLKREPGYDAEHGDWEYVYVTTDWQRKVIRGRLKNCIDCHQKTSATDYLYLNYNDDETEHAR